MRLGETFGIQYASHIANEGFIRFTVAHELGHYFLPGHAEHLFRPVKGYTCREAGSSRATDSSVKQITLPAHC